MPIIDRYLSRWSKKYRQALVRDANASWDADAQAAASETSSVPSSSEGGPSSSSTMSNLDMSTRRSSMSTGSFGAGRIFAASELDAALDAMSGVEGDETGDVVPNPTPSSGRLSIDSTLSGPTIPTALASAHRRKPGDRGRHVRFAEEVTTIPHVDLYDDEDTDHDPSSLDGDNPAGSDNILAKRGEASLKPPKAPAVKKLTKALKRAFSREKLGGRTVYAA